MKLKEYLAQNNLEVVQFAVKSDVGVSTIYRHLSGKGKLYLKTAIKIERATGGLVSVQELRSEHD